jgi:hypothetical protein
VDVYVFHRGGKVLHVFFDRQTFDILEAIDDGYRRFWNRSLLRALDEFVAVTRSSSAG